MRSFIDVFGSTPKRLHEIETPRGVQVTVPSFVDDHYAENFADQWVRFRDTQLDSANGTSISQDFLEELLDDPISSLEGLEVLEIGAGAGRFTELLAAHARLVVATDLSEAIFVNAGLGAPNVIAAQADVLGTVFRSRFDLVLCRGVLQHTPDPRRAIAVLHSLVKPGGALVFDIYGKRGIGFLRPKYLWRPLIRQMFTFGSFASFLDRHAARALRFRWRVNPYLPGPTKRILDYLIPLWDYRGILPLSSEQLVEWAKLDTLDAMFAAYDKPMSPSEVVDVLLKVGFKELSIDPDRDFYRLKV